MLVISDCFPSIKEALEQIIKLLQLEKDFELRRQSTGSPNTSNDWLLPNPLVSYGQSDGRQGQL